MDSSKVVQGTEECSSSESGWTMYIDSPEKGYNDDDNDDDDDGDDGSLAQQGFKKDSGEDADSDDSMASDASSGPSDQGNVHRDYSHAGKRDEIKYVSKKRNQQEENKKKQHEQIKAGKDKAGNRANSSGRLKKI